MSDNTYEGWKNKATWNVSLWVNNDEGLYRSAVDFMEKDARKDKRSRAPYTSFIRSIGLGDERTQDGFKYLSSSLCYSELNDMMRELV